MEIKATKRSVLGKKSKLVRAEKKLPAALYGKGVETVPLEVDYIAFKKIYKEAGQSTLIDLAVEGEKPVKVLVHEAQQDPVTSQYIHASFFQIDLKKDITATIPLVLTNGEKCPAVVEGGLLVQPVDEVEIRCKPLELPHQIEIDVSEAKIGDTIAIGDLKLPEGVRLVRDEEKTLTAVSAIMPQEEEEKPAEVATASEVGAEGAPAEGAKEGEEGVAKKPMMTQSLKSDEEKAGTLE